MPELRITASQRETVARRANDCCEYCYSQADYSPDPFSVEHIIPRSRGGTNELANLAYSCQGCNNRKYTDIQAIDPATGELARLYHPRQDVWAEHFAWSDEFALILGLTPSGRATVEKLHLNRQGVVNLRRALRLIHKHPPTSS